MISIEFFFFISAPSDVLGSLWISRVFSCVIQADENPPALTYPEQLSNLIKKIKFHLSETFPSTYIYFGSYQLSSLLLLLEVSKNHYEKKNISVGGSEKHRFTFSISFKTNFAKLIWVDFGKSEFWNIHFFNWYNAVYSPFDSIFWHLEFIKSVPMISHSFSTAYS